MAQISLGVKLGYVQAASPRNTPSYAYIPDVTGIPSLGSAPATHDVTHLENEAKVYIKGLIDTGGNLDFPCLFTSAAIDAVDTAIGLEDNGDVEWCVEFPKPLDKRAYFTAEAAPVYNEAVDVDAPILGNISLVPTSEIKWEAM